MIKITETVKHLIIINVVMFLGTMTIGNGELFYKWFSLYFPGGESFEPWQILTHMFMHGGFMHLFFNMLGVWMFGSAVEQALGSKRFLFLYFSAGIGAVMLQLGVDYLQYSSIYDSLQSSGLSLDSISKMLKSGVATYASNPEQIEMLKELFVINNTPMVGASGCLMGILVAFGVLNPNAELMLIFFPIPIKAKYFIPLLIGYDVISGFLGGASVFGMNVAHWAHVGGAAVGLIIILFWKNDLRSKYRID